LNNSSKQKLIIWDLDDLPPSGKMVLLFNRYKEDDEQASVLNIIDEKADELRKDYLQLIRDFGEEKINGRRIIDHLEVDSGLSLWWMTLLAEKNPIKSKTMQYCLRLMAVNLHIREIQPESIEFYSINSDIVEAIEGLCNSLQRPFIHKSKNIKDKDWDLKRIYRGLPHVIQGPLFLAYYVLKNWSLRKVPKPEWFDGDSAIFIFSYFFNLDQEACSNNRFYSRQWESFPEYLVQKGRNINWFHHYLSFPDGPDKSTAIHWLGEFNNLPQKHNLHIFLASYLSAKIVIKTLFQWMRTVLIMVRNNRSIEALSSTNPKGWLWPIMRNDWRCSVLGRVAIQNFLWVNLFDVAMGDLPKQDMGIYLCENLEWERIFVHYWKKYGHGRLIAVQHATIRYWDLRYFDHPQVWESKDILAKPLPDQIAVNGPLAWDILKNAGQPMFRLVKVEALRYLHLEKFKSIRATKNYTIDKVKTPKELLILGDSVNQTTTAMLRLLESANTIFKDGYSLSFKPHPANPINLGNFPHLNMTYTDAPLEKLLLRCNCVICSIYTSASIEAIAIGLPVITILDSQELNFSPLLGVPDTSFVSNIGELNSALVDQFQKQVAVKSQNYFWTNHELPRWTALLKIDG